LFLEYHYARRMLSCCNIRVLLHWNTIVTESKWTNQWCHTQTKLS